MDEPIFQWHRHRVDTSSSRWVTHSASSVWGPSWGCLRRPCACGAAATLALLLWSTHPLASSPALATNRETGQRLKSKMVHGDEQQGAATPYSEFVHHPRLNMSGARRAAPRDHAAAFAIATSSSTLMRLKAVQSFFKDLDRLKERSQSSQSHAARRRKRRRAGTPQADAQFTGNHSRTPGLVLTRRYSGRLQQGCVGGCF